MSNEGFLVIYYILCVIYVSLFAHFLGETGVDGALDVFGALIIAIFAPVIMLVVMIMALAPLIWDGFYYHQYSYGMVGDVGRDVYVYATLGFGIVLSIPWLLIEDERGVPPGLRFLSNFYVHPGKRHVDRAIGGEHAPTFSAEAFTKATKKPRGKWGQRLAQERLEQMSAAAEAEAGRLRGIDAALAEKEQLAQQAKEEALRTETEYTEAQREVLQKSEELEVAKARLEERRKRRG